jgi:glycosyltransferase involved in cell wall biosynthesis
MASTLSKEKGVLTAVDAMEQIHKQLPKAQLLVFGDGPLEDTLREKAKDASKGNIHLRGRVPPAELYDEMATATATIFPSEWAEPFGRVTVESMSLGTPVVGSHVGGIAEIINDGETGLLFRPGNVDELSNRLIDIAMDSVNWSQLSEAGIRRAERFSTEQVAEEHISLYKKIISL